MQQVNITLSEVVAQRGKNMKELKRKWWMLTKIMDCRRWKSKETVGKGRKRNKARQPSSEKRMTKQKESKK